MAVQFTDAEVVTTEQGQALRQADCLVFHLRDGKSYIRALKENVGVWKETKEIRIDCDHIIENSRGYGDNRRDMGNVVGASEVENHVRYQPHLRTMLAKIKKGDRLALRWRANNNNQYADKNGLFNDELFLIIEKPNGKQEEYFVSYSTCENNTAKMIKNETTPKSVIGDY